MSMSLLENSYYEKEEEVKTEPIKNEDVTTIGSFTVSPVNRIGIIEDVLAQMQDTLTTIKTAKENQNILAQKVSELSLLLAEAQAEEIKAAEVLLDLEISWHELIQNFLTFGGDLNVSCNQPTE